MKIVKVSRDKRQVLVRLSLTEVEDLRSASTFTIRTFEKVRKERSPDFKKVLKRLDKGLLSASKRMNY